MSGIKIAKFRAQKYTDRVVKPAPKLTHQGKSLKKGVNYALAYEGGKTRDGERRRERQEGSRVRRR